MEFKSEIEQLIEKALVKVGGKHEKDICRYLPGEQGGYIHHFTMKKLRKSDPKAFKKMLEECILEAKNPRPLDPKPRIRRNRPLSLNQSDLKLVLKLARETGDRFLLAKLENKLSLSQLKRELINSIKGNRLEEELWSAYVQAMETFAQKAPA